MQKKKLNKDKAKMIKSSKSKNKVYDKLNSSLVMGINTDTKIWAENEKKIALIRIKLLKKQTILKTYNFSNISKL